MRLVQFPCLDGKPDYDQFGGASAFRKTSLSALDGYCVGEYVGGLDAGTLPDYPGTWPEPSYVRSMSKTDFKGLFTATEYRAISTLAGNNDNAFQFWDMAQTADNIDMDDPRTLAGLSYVSGMGAVTAERLQTILKGKPV
jgi:hypothetical protein